MFVWQENFQVNVEMSKKVIFFDFNSNNILELSTEKPDESGKQDEQ